MLSTPGVEGNGGGGRCIQRLALRIERDLQSEITVFLCFLSYPFPLVPQDKDGWFGELLTGKQRVTFPRQRVGEAPH